MADVIAFPRRMRTDGPEPFEQSVDDALASYLDLSTKIERIITDLEASLSVLSAALPGSPPHPEKSPRIAELEEQLITARQMVATIRAEIEILKTPSSA